MKKLTPLFLLFLFSCSKEELIVPVTTSIPISSKDYKQSSYNLQHTNVSVDLLALRAIGGTTSIYGIGYLDINGDGNDDIFMSSALSSNSRTPAQMYIYKNGTYVPDNSYFNEVPSMELTRKVLIGDFNNDKRPDIFLCGHGYDFDPFVGEYNQMLLSNASGKYDLKKFDKIGFFHGGASGDIDNDGDLDIFVLDGGYYAKPNTHFLINDGKGNFTYSQSQIDITKLYGQYSSELIDVNKDGYLDLLFGGHEMDKNNNTVIYWGSSSFTYTIDNMTIIPRVPHYGVVMDFDVYDLDGDGHNELVVNRAGGEMGPGGYVNFYNGWYIQVLDVAGKMVSDQTSNFIENNSTDYSKQTPWIIWLRFDDVDNNGKVDLFSTRSVYGLELKRWELRDKKLVRLN